MATKPGAPEGAGRLKSAFTLETLLTHPKLFNLQTATPTQRAICRVAQGLPLAELATDPQVVAAFGGPEAVAALPGVMPHELIILAAIRSGKSLFTAALAVFASQTCDFTDLGPGEIPRVSIVSLTKGTAQVVLNHILGRVQASPVLKGLIEGEPRYDSVFLKHPSGRLVEICVVPMDRAGGSVVARWSAGCVIDEAPRLQSEEDGVENYDEVRRAVFARMRPGAQLISVGSPWAPRGSIYNKVQERFGNPGSDLVVMKATGPAMNPFFWTPAKVEATKLEPTVYRTDVLAEFADPEATLFTADLVEKCCVLPPEPLPPEKFNEYTAAMDPATRGNSWPLIIVTQEGGIKKVVLCKQWTGSKHQPINPDTTLAQVFKLVTPYRIDTLAVDQFGGDTMAALARRHGLTLVENWVDKQFRYEIFDRLYRMMLDGKVQLPNDPALKADLMSVKKRVTSAGVDIFLPKIGGRHADLAFALALAMRPYLEDPVVPGPAPGTVEYIKLRALEDRARIVEGRRNEFGEEDAWWEKRPE